MTIFTLKTQILANITRLNSTFTHSEHPYVQKLNTFYSRVLNTPDEFETKAWQDSAIALWNLWVSKECSKNTMYAY